MNPILTNIEQAVRAKVVPENRDELERVVIAGKKIMFDPKTHANLEMIKNPESRKDPINTVSKGITGLMWAMYIQSRRTMKPQVMVFAGIILMCEFFDFAERGLKVKIDANVIARTTELLAQSILERMGVTKDKLPGMIQSGAQEIADYKSGKLTPEQIKAKYMSPEGESESGLPPPQATGAPEQTPPQGAPQ